MLTIPDGGSMVLFRRAGVEYDRQEVARRLAVAANVLLFDARSYLAHHHGGIVANHLDPDVASRFAESLQAIELPAEVLHASQLVTPVFIGHVRRLDYDAEVLRLEAERRGTVEVPWSRVLVVSIGQMEDVADDLVGALTPPPPATGKRPTFIPTAVKSSPALVLDIYSSADNQAASINTRSLPFAHLGERMKETVLENVRLTLRDVLRNAETAAHNDPAGCFVDGGPVAEIRYPDMARFKAECLWLLQAKSQGWLS